MNNNEAYIRSPDNPRTAAVVCYITFIGWLISYFALYKNARNPITAYHLRQTLLLHILTFIMNIISAYVFWYQYAAKIILVALGIGMFILWLLGLIDALNGRQKPVPLLGKAAQKIFKNL